MSGSRCDDVEASEAALERRLRDLLGGGRRRASRGAAAAVAHGVAAVLGRAKPALLYDSGACDSACLAAAAAAATTSSSKEHPPCRHPTCRQAAVCPVTAEGAARAGGHFGGDSSAASERIIVLELREGRESNTNANSDDGDGEWEAADAPSSHAHGRGRESVVAQFVALAGPLRAHLRALARSLELGGTFEADGGRVDAGAAVADGGGGGGGGSSSGPGPTEATAMGSNADVDTVCLVHVGGDCPRLATRGEAALLRDALRKIASALQDVSLPTSDAGAAERCGAAGEAAAEADVVAVEVGDVNGWPLVGVVGALLGYPVVYLAGADGKNCLGERDLVRWTLSCSGGAGLVGADDGRCVVTAFTVPAGMASLPCVASAVGRWRERVARRACACAALRDARVDCAVVSHPSVAL